MYVYFWIRYDSKSKVNHIERNFHFTKGCSYKTKNKRKSKRPVKEEREKKKKMRETNKLLRTFLKEK